jgi:hypothetical protein
MNRYLKIFGLSVVVVLLCLYISISFSIGHQVRDAVTIAQISSQGDPVTALLAVVNSSDATLDAKNQAIWALGQLGDSRALPTLEALVTNEECDHSLKLCQQGLEKAIPLCRGERNLGAFIWRHGELASN